MKPVATMIRKLGIRPVINIDDILVMAETREQARDHTCDLIYIRRQNNVPVPFVYKVRTTFTPVVVRFQVHTSTASVQQTSTFYVRNGACKRNVYAGLGQLKHWVATYNVW